MSITYDETLHTTAAYVIRHYSDFRVNPEDPPLFQHFAALALPAGSLDPDLNAPQWREMLDVIYSHWIWSNDAMFGRAAQLVSHVDMLARVRGLMLVPSGLLLMATLLLVMVLARNLTSGDIQISPPGRRDTLSQLSIPGLSVVLAGFVFTFEPTLIGHASLVKNDIAISLFFTVVTLALVMMTRRVSVPLVLLLASAAGAGCATKFSGLLLGPFVLLILLSRALLPAPWRVLSLNLTTRTRRVAAALAVVIVCSVVSYFTIWAAYRFQFTPSPDPQVHMNLKIDLDIARYHARIKSSATTIPTLEDSRTSSPPLPVSLMTQALEYHLLPEPYVKGFIYTYGSTYFRWGFLLNEISPLGWRSYFPLCLAFKLPLGTLVLLVILTVVALVMLLRRAGRLAASSASIQTGSLVPLHPLYFFMPPLVLGLLYLFLAVAGSFNIGIRHLLPVFPLAIAVFCAFLAYLLITHSGWILRGILLLALLAIPIETLASHHRYIAFFNLPARLAGPERLLGDSNLDWGQDLPLLVEWQQRNPYTTLSLSYFGTATPEAYGLRYIPLQGTNYSLSPVVVTPPPGVIAYSVTHLQEINLKSSERGLLEFFRRLKPIERLGGTLFLYNWPPSRADFATEEWPLYVRTFGKLEKLPSGPLPTPPSPPSP